VARQMDARRVSELAGMGGESVPGKLTTSVHMVSPTPGTTAAGSRDGFGSRMTQALPASTRTAAGVGFPAARRTEDHPAEERTP